MGDTRRYTDESRQRGQAAHLALAALLRQQRVALAPQYQGYVESIQAALDGLAFVPVAVERRLRDGDVTGRPDAVGYVTRGPFAGPAVLDGKTCVPAAWHGVQVAMYARLAESLRDAMPAAVRRLPWLRMALRLKPDGRLRFVFVPLTDPDDYRAADAALDLARWRSAHGVFVPADGVGDFDGDDPFGSADAGAGTADAGGSAAGPV